MGKYCQYLEEEFLNSFFKSDYKGFVVEIGAADGLTNSNSRLLIENGWDGLLVEPNKENYKKIKNLYEGHTNIIIENLGCSNKSVNSVDFFVDKNDSYQQLSTFSLEQKNKCVDIYNCDFVNDKIDLIKTSELFEKHNIKKIDFLSVDTESYDTNVILGIDFSKVFVKLLCVEHISEEMIIFLKNHSFVEIHKTTGNIFFENK